MEKPKKIGSREFARLVAKEIGVSNSKVVDRWLRALLIVMVNELLLCEEVTVPNIGTFRLLESGGETKLMPTRSGELVERYVEPKLVVRYRPSLALKEALNGKREIYVKQPNKKAYSRRLEKLDEESATIEERKWQSRRVRKKGRV